MDYLYLVLRECKDDDLRDDTWAFTDFGEMLRAVANSQYDPDTLEVLRVLDGITNLDDDESFTIDLGYELRKAGYVKED